MEEIQLQPLHSFWRGYLWRISRWSLGPLCQPSPGTMRDLSAKSALWWCVLQSSAPINGTVPWVCWLSRKFQTRDLVFLNAILIFRPGTFVYLWISAVLDRKRAFHSLSGAALWLISLYLNRRVAICFRSHHSLSSLILWYAWLMTFFLGWPASCSGLVFWTGHHWHGSTFINKPRISFSYD